jgi:uncharacterized phage protein gp47/JayE
MAGPYPLPTLGATIDANGITAPAYEDILASLQTSYMQIYGSDVDLAADSQDGQWIAIQAQAIFEANQAVIAAYLSYSPTYAQGVGLSSVVKINGIRRLVPSPSTVELLLVGRAGKTIANGVVADEFNNLWDLPPTVEIPVAGQVNVTATAEEVGAIQAAPGTVTAIQTLMPGWDSATNPDSAAPGAPVEDDATLRQRQTYSTALPAITPRESILGNVLNAAGVQRAQVWENDTDQTDANGIPSHSVSVVVEGGTDTDIATIIARTKNVGCGTYGDTSIVVYDSHGAPNTINFFYLTLIPIYVVVTIRPRSTYVDVSGLIAQSVAAFLNDEAIGEPVYAAWLYAPAELSGDVAVAATGQTQDQLDQISATYVIQEIAIGTVPGPTASYDILIPFNCAASGDPANVSVVLGTPAPAATRPPPRRPRGSSSRAEG